MSQKIKNRALIITVLGLLTTVGPFSIDMYLPGLGAIAASLGSTIDRVQLSLTSFFFGIAVGQLIYGPLLDRFGRKPPLVTGLLVYIATSVVLAMAASVEALVAWRFVQALGSCAGMVAARALVRDYFPPHETARVFSLLMLILGVSPVLAPTIGGYLIHFLGWPSVFITLALIVAAVLLAVVVLLPEKKGPDASISLRPGRVLATFGQVAHLPQFAVFATASALTSAGLYAWLSGSAFVMMELYGINEREFGWIFAFLASGIILASQANNLLLKRYDSVSISRVAGVWQALWGVALLGTSLLPSVSLPMFVALLFLYLLCEGFVFPNTSALALNPFSRLAGNASALMGALQMAVGALASYLTSALFNGTTLPMTAVMAACSVACCWLILARGTRMQLVEEVM
ncbi:MAG TPA: multidrug effflux MFS transporter [Flavobacteriales bacterium]|nr:multidrug effflux MFS transporter [Flavobacteriales bacterium]HRP82009.1 multidrug effflux MFS transporter [Flavobacteriales bacterium]